MFFMRSHSIAESIVGQAKATDLSKIGWIGISLYASFLQKTGKEKQARSMVRSLIKMSFLESLFFFSEEPTNLRSSLVGVDATVMPVCAALPSDQKCVEVLRIVLNYICGGCSPILMGFSQILPVTLVVLIFSVDFVG